MLDFVPLPLTVSPARPCLERDDTAPMLELFSRCVRV